MPTPAFLAELGAQLRAHPGQLPAPRVGPAAVRDHRGRLPPSRPGGGGRRGARRVLDHRPARVAGLPEPALALGQPDAPGALLGAPSLPGPRREPVGGDRRPLQGQRLGGGLQPHERAGRRVARRRRPVLRAPRGGDPSRRPRPHPVVRRQHVLDRVRLLRRAARQRRLHPARLRARGPRSRGPLRPRGGRAEVPRALGVRARDGDADLRRRVRAHLHGRPRDRRRARADPRGPARALPPPRRRLRDVDVQGPRPPGPDLREARLALRRARGRLRRQEDPAGRGPVGQHRARVPGGHAADPGPRRARGAGL